MTSRFLEINQTPDWSEVKTTFHPSYYLFKPDHASITALIFKKSQDLANELDHFITNKKDLTEADLHRVLGPFLAKHFAYNILHTGSHLFKVAFTSIFPSVVRINQLKTDIVAFLVILRKWTPLLSTGVSGATVPLECVSRTLLCFLAVLTMPRKALIEFLNKLEEAKNAAQSGKSRTVFENLRTQHSHPSTSALSATLPLSSSHPTQSPLDIFRKPDSLLSISILIPPIGKAVSDLPLQTLHRPSSAVNLSSSLPAQVNPNEVLFPSLILQSQNQSKTDTASKHTPFTADLSGLPTPFAAWDDVLKHNTLTRALVETFRLVDGMDGSGSALCASSTHAIRSSAILWERICGTVIDSIAFTPFSTNPTVPSEVQQLSPPKQASSETEQTESLSQPFISFGDVVRFVWNRPDVQQNHSEAENDEAQEILPERKIWMKTNPVLERSDCLEVVELLKVVVKMRDT
ncbi:hypothetical protein BLNAU_13475 [Blattamonas nauphoetae]|uniref:PXA domain-containing protein n=1 Tax=Blattamonas nauphoetae TaxID=2049346 RepID=A0ABQ9XGK8_9EUKA|nr:hypothetical protein BLNAU_13475 [Blattamonas nauphoetae]